MVRKLNRKAAEAYSENFSRKVLDDFFSRQPASATGQDILELTPVQQVNLLIIQRLYQRWQEEALQLRSPYFNFEHPQVQESLQAFMNTLSRHIQVEREALEPLLRDAVYDTLLLLFSPMAFFDNLLHDYAKPANLQASLRYLRMQQALTEVVYEQVEEKTTTEPEYILAILEASIRSGKLTLEPVEEHVEAFEQVLLFPKGLVDDPTPVSALPPKEEPTDFFSAVSGMGSRPARNTPKEAAPAPASNKAVSRDEPEEAPLKQAPLPAPAPTESRGARIIVNEPEPAPRRVSTPAPEPTPTAPDPDAARKTVRMQPVPTVSTPMPAPAAPAKRQEDEIRKVNTRPEGNERKPLYEKFEQKESRSANLSQKQRSSNIRHYITLNQRFMFVKELFNGDGGGFNAALDALDACNNMQEAQQWVQQHLANKPQWQEESEPVQEFYNVLEHRFGS